MSNVTQAILSRLDFNKDGLFDLADIILIITDISKDGKITKEDLVSLAVKIITK